MHRLPRTGRGDSSPRRSSSIAILLLVAALTTTSIAEPQYFGRNKVLWENFDFQVLESEHFLVHTYPPDSAVDRQLARLSERWYARLSDVFRHQFEERKPLVIYANHADFQQTLTTGGLIGEGTGGFTEPLQDRVVMPLTGVNAENAHVLGHELVHAFQFDIAERFTPGPGRQVQLMQLPLWLVEGLAEYLSQGRQDAQTAMWMRDAIVHDLLPDPERPQRLRLSPYQYGQALWAYIAGRWGDGIIRPLFLDAALTGVETAFRDRLDLSVEELLADFHASLRSAYQPVIAERSEPATYGTPLLHSDQVGADLNVAPSYSPDGLTVAFLSTRDLFSLDLYLADADSGEIITRLVSADADPHFDALSFIDSSAAWSPDGDRLAFVVFAKGDQQIVTFDVERRRVIRRISPEGIEAVRNPSFSPDGRTIVFSGYVHGTSDLFLYDLEGDRLTRLTDDLYSDIQPKFSPDGRTIAFVSDRGPQTDLEQLAYGPLQLALLDVASGEVDVLDLFDDAKHIDPSFAPDGRSLYFVSDPEGVPDVFRYDLETGSLLALTRLQTGATGITDLSPSLTVASAAGSIAYSALEGGKWNIYRLEDRARAPYTRPPGRIAAILPPAAPATGAATSEVESYLADTTAGLPQSEAQYPTADYSPRLRLAYLGPPSVGIGVDRFGLGAGGSISAYYSDLLGRHQLGFTFQGGSSGGGLDFAESIGGEVFYLNQENRFQWGAQVSHIPFLSGRTALTQEVVEIDGEPVLADVIEERLQVVTVDQAELIGQYPLSFTRRIEVAVGATRYDFNNRVNRFFFVGSSALGSERVDLPDPEAIDIYSGSAALVGDTSYFGFISPLRGGRYRLELEANSGDLEFQTAIADFRRYFFARPVTFAFRALHYGRYGTDQEDERLNPLYVGRSALVRGYDIDSFDAAECTRIDGSNRCPEFERLIGSRLAVASFELRLPLFGTEQFGLIELRWLPTELALFVDAGAAWTEDSSVELDFVEDTIERVPVVSAGIAARVLLGGYLPIELYYAHPFQRPDSDGEFGFTISTGW
ncbi:MAG TPA: BamA/TamA family outer membrane protein [Thermoanaerobaculia bacterium]|nr:BamA/TamA family outer membrane protein [Thermoanaerobaculia bacterium]